MGLDTTHGCWHGSYSSFNTFRRKLANEIGINLNEYEGYGDFGTKDLNSIDHEIAPLLNHSDCDGVLTPLECKSIASGLKKILHGIQLTNENKYFFDQIVKFRKGCLSSYSENENVEFH